MKITKLMFVIINILGSFSLTAHAGSLDCKGDFAEIGDSKGSVLFKCGEPMLKDSFLKQTKKDRSNSKQKTPCTLLPNANQ